MWRVNIEFNKQNTSNYSIFSSFQKRKCTDLDEWMDGFTILLIFLEKKLIQIVYMNWDYVPLNGSIQSFSNILQIYSSKR